MKRHCGYDSNPYREVYNARYSHLVTFEKIGKGRTGLNLRRGKIRLIWTGEFLLAGIMSIIFNGESDGDYSEGYFLEPFNEVIIETVIVKPIDLLIVTLEEGPIEGPERVQEDIKEDIKNEVIASSNQGVTKELPLIIYGVIPMEERRELLLKAGWEEQWIEEAIKVVQCESNWNPQAGRDYKGLFQIHLETWFTYYNEPFERWNNPFVNAQIAWRIFNYDLDRNSKPWNQWECKP